MGWLQRRTFSFINHKFQQPSTTDGLQVVTRPHLPQTHQKTASRRHPIYRAAAAANKPCRPTTTQTAQHQNRSQGNHKDHHKSVNTASELLLKILNLSFTAYIKHTHLQLPARHGLVAALALLVDKRNQQPSTAVCP
jgi:hypothetical protein